VLTVYRVTDLYLRRSAGRPETVLGHVDLDAAADDVATRAQPGTLLELQAQRHRLRQDAVNGCRQPRRLEHDQADAGTACMCSQPAQSLVVTGADPSRQVHHEQVDPVFGNECGSECPALGKICRPENEQPAQVDAARHRLEWVKAAAQVEERDDTAACLGLGQAVQRQRRLAARAQAAERHADTAWQAAGAEQRVEMCETGGHDVVRQPCRAWSDRWQRGESQCACHRRLYVMRLAAAEAHRGTSPARLEARQRSGQNRVIGHPAMIEQMF